MQQIENQIRTNSHKWVYHFLIFVVLVNCVFSLVQFFAALANISFGSAFASFLF